MDRLIDSIPTGIAALRTGVADIYRNHNGFVFFSK